jgi:hypothetical protein
MTNPISPNDQKALAAYSNSDAKLDLSDLRCSDECEMRKFYESHHSEDAQV